MNERIAALCIPLAERISAELQQMLEKTGLPVMDQSVAMIVTTALVHNLTVEAIRGTLVVIGEKTGRPFPTGAYDRQVERSRELADKLAKEIMQERLDKNQDWINNQFMVDRD